MNKGLFLCGLFIALFLAGTGLTIHRSHRTRFPENHVLRSRTRPAPIIYDGIRNRSTKREKSE